MAEDAINIAKSNGIVFPKELDKLGTGEVTALFLVHAGKGAEAISDATQRANNMWSHKYNIPTAINVGPGLVAYTYLTVPEDALVGVCAHELGHLAFQWDDFYDPVDDDGWNWDGAGYWDLMAGGSWNNMGNKPAHPAGLHITQHNWVKVVDVTSDQPITLQPFSPAIPSTIYRIKGKGYTSTQFLLLENRSRIGFDIGIPGEGLLVWRVDTSREMGTPQRPALMLLQADGRRDLERLGTQGDAGDPFPGSTNQTSLNDSGTVSTTFPGALTPSGVFLRNIARNAVTGVITCNVIVGSSTAGKHATASETANAAIPDSNTNGISRTINIAASGTLVSIDINVNITHSFAADLIIELKSPVGTSVILHNKEGGSSPYVPRIFRPLGFVGQAIQGTWTLKVSDRAALDTGTLNNWSIDITYQ